MAQKLDLMAALGTPSSGSTPKGKPAKSKAGSSYLASKSPTLKAYLLDAVDDSLSQEERAEALCRAIEENATGGGASEMPSADSAVGAGFEDY